MINDQLILDLDFSNDQSDSTVTISSGTNILDSLSTDSFTLNSNWDTSYNDCITIGGQTITENKLKVLDGLQDWQEEVNKKLAILQPNPKLEDRWEELKSLREQYIALEKDLLDKEKVWDIIKS
jgi:hypothetical protein|tara:strand:+ start:504 stop:875 length:372 start_codon:yes stop_codon:yes gene_type:complete